ncbi:MAG: tetratricopeptide repeat protein [Planctomycetes bacterium]|nr:tetratricopeptide repeat protein [Planctomycetota bacterium]
MKAKKIIGMLAVLVLLAAGVGWFLFNSGPVVEEAAEETSDWIIPEFDLTEFQPPVADTIRQSRLRLVANPRSSKAWFYYGAVLDAHKLIAEAEICYRKAQELDPNDRLLIYNYAMLIASTGSRHDEAIAMFERASQLMSDYLPVWYRLGRLRLEKGEIEQAKKMYDVAMTLHIDMPAVHYELGQIYVSLGDMYSGLEHLKRAAELLPDDSSIYAALSRAYLKDGDQERATAASKMASQYELKLSLPDPVREGVMALAMDSNSCLQRGIAKMNGDNYAEAIPDLQVAAATLTTNSNLQLRLGICFYNVDQIELAEKHLHNALELRDDIAQAYLYQGIIAVKKFDYAGGVEHYRSAIKHDPDNVRIHMLLGGALVMDQKLKEADRVFSQSRSLGDLDAGAYMMWGNALIELGQINNAISKLNLAIGLAPQHPALRLNMGSALEKLGENAQAIEQYRKAIELDPSFALARERLQALEGTP